MTGNLRGGEAVADEEEDFALTGGEDLEIGGFTGLGESPRRGAFCSALMTLNSSILLLRLGDRLGL